MAHCRVLFVGTINNLDQIYANCSDSSSESKAELAFGYDYLKEYSKKVLLGELNNNSSISYNPNDYEFTKKDLELYDKYIIKRQYDDCFDIRDNTSNHYINALNKADIDVFFSTLPDDAHFFLCDGHL